MSAARYWRLVGITTSADSADLAISEIQLMGSGGRLDEPGMLAASLPPVVGSVDVLSDGAASAVCVFRASDVREPGFCLAWDLGAASEVIGIRLGSGADRGGYLDMCMLQSSADGRAWNAAVQLGRSKWPGAFALAEPMLLGDPYATLNRLLLHFDGNFLDASSAGVSVSVSDGVTITGAARFGAGAASFGGSGFLTVPGNVIQTAGSITIEAQVKMPSGRSGMGTLYANYRGLRNNLCYIDSNGAVGWYYDGNNAIWTSAGSVASDVWQHVRLVKIQGSPVATFLVCVGGVVLASTTAPQPVFGDAGSDVAIGDAQWTSGRRFVGMVDEFVVTAEARSTGSFVPPEVAYLGGGSGADALQPPRVKAAALVIAASSPTSLAAVAFARAQMVRDIEHGGAGRIWGTTKTKGTLTNVPTKARVVLFHQRSKLLVRETWSDPATGAFEFVGIDTRQDFLVLAEDAAGSFRPVAASRLVPEVAP